MAPKRSTKFYSVLLALYVIVLIAFLGFAIAAWSSFKAGRTAWHPYFVISTGLFVLLIALIVIESIESNK